MKTERIGFSYWTLEDEELAVLLWTQPEVTRYISASGYFSKEEAKERMRTEIKRMQDYGMQYYPIFHLESGELIGAAGLRPYAQNIPEIGLHIRSKFWYSGYGYEAGKALISYAFSHLSAKRIFAGHNPENIRSARLLKRLNFVYSHDEYYAPTGLMHPSYFLDEMDFSKIESEKKDIRNPL